MMLLKLFVVSVVSYGATGLVCEPPRHGSIEYGERNRVILQCDDGFRMLGPSDGTCDELTGEIDAQVICLPILKGEGNCGDRCPVDYRYILDFVLDDATEKQKQNAEAIEEKFQANRMAKATGRNTLLCKTVCPRGIGSCFSLRGLPRKAKKLCVNCFIKNRCGLAFWG